MYPINKDGFKSILNQERIKHIFMSFGRCAITRCDPSFKLGFPITEPP